MKKYLISALVVAGLTFSGAASAKKLKFQMSSKAGDWAHTYMAKHAPVLSELTNGELQIEGLPTKSVVPHRETIDAVANGILDGDFNAIAYFAGRDPAFAIMGDLIAGYDTPEQYQEYCMHGGGKEMLQKIYDKVLPGKIHVLGCGPYGKEALVSKVPINGVWIQAVLEHVVEPQVVVAEIYRVLRASGIVYAETPFMQQVHEGAFDFTRFTVLGHRYLFRDFEIVDAGGNKGAETVLAWSIRYFTWALTRSRFISRLVGLGMHVLLKPFAAILSRKALFDSSSGVFFLGRKSTTRVSHRELTKLYDGLC